MADRTKAALAAVGAALLIAFPALLLAPSGVEGRIEQAVADAGRLEITSWASFAVAGRTVTISGEAPSQEHLNLTVALFESLAGVGSVDADGVTVLQIVSPYAFSVTRDGDTVTLAGYAPSEETRAALVAAVEALPAVTVSDELEIAAGAPAADFEAAARGLIRAMGLVSTGKAALTDLDVEIAGTAVGDAAYATLSSATSLLPGGYALSAVAIDRPVKSPFVFEATRSGDALVLGGYVPSIAAEETVLGAARAAAGMGLRLVNGVTVAGGAPDDFTTVAATAVAALSRLEAGSVRLVDTSVTVDGMALTPADARGVVQFIETFKPAGYTVESIVADPVVKPFVLTIARTPEAMSVSGFLPPSASQQTLSQSLSAGAKTLRLQVETSVASGAPEGFADALAFATGAARLIDSGSVMIEDTGISIRGTTSTSGRFADLNRLLERLPAGYSVRSEVAPPTVPVWAWTLQRTGRTLTVTGFIPSERDRAGVLEALAAALPEAAVTDGSVLASGMPEGFDPVGFAEFAARQLAVLDGGAVMLEGDQAVVKGTTASADAAALVRSAFAVDLPVGLVSGAIDIASPPTTRLVVTARAGGVDLVGTVPSATARQAALEAAATAFGTLPVSDRLRVTPELDPRSTGVAELAVIAASRLHNGVVSVVDRRIRVSGSTFHPAATASVRAFLESNLPAGYTIDADFGYRLAMPIVTPDVCQAMAADVIANFPIRFTETGALDPAGAGGIDRLVNVAFRCPQARIVVVPAGAGDRAIEAARASSVQAALVSAGVTEGRVKVGSPEASTTASAEPALAFGG